MIQVVVSIGSNIKRRKNTQYALQQLCQQFGQVEVSSLYETSAVGFDGPFFYNMVAYFATNLSINEVISCLRKIESDTGRSRATRNFTNRSLDIDIILFGDADLRTQGYNIPRDDIIKYAYVLKPLADLLPHHRHPVLPFNFAQMWQKFDHKDQQIKLVNKDFK